MERELYAKVIIDIGHPDLDHYFEYVIPDKLSEVVTEGCSVTVPFGNGSRQKKAFVIGISDHCEYDRSKLKEIISVNEKEVSIESRMIKIASWIRYRYGCTMIQALKTVMPVRKKVAQKKNRLVRCETDSETLSRLMKEAEKKHYHARARVLEAFQKDKEIPYSILAKNLSVNMTTLNPMIKAGVISVAEKSERRQKLYSLGNDNSLVTLNEEQQAAVDGIISGLDEGDMRPSLIYGVTASGKTEIYMELIAHVLKAGKQAIVLIPEIALTYPTMMRFYRRFGERIGFVHSRLSDGEKYEQVMLASEGKIDIMIGPRSALFTPFSNLGLIVVDEEHDGAYNSDQTPKYHAVETAEELAKIAGAGLVLGSATPSLKSYTKALNGEYRLFSIKKRAKEGSCLAEVHIVDMRKELESGNRSAFSRELADEINDVLNRHEQAMLFLNRRGYSSFVSCRSCGHVMKCPHCDVSLSYHKSTGRLHCHYCDYSEDMPKTCPKCTSKYIAGFKSGTQKIEELLKKEFPSARVLRMDRDTVREKDGYEKILNAFSSGDADILVGTQMIVKGHDFPKVTLMGVLAADLSLYAPDYMASERTFQLLTQAAGRAGRSDVPGKVIIQTYTPDHFSIETAASQDYEQFYAHEMIYRKLLSYPPVSSMLTCLVTSLDEKKAQEAAERLSEIAKLEDIQVFGPVDDAVSKLRDMYRKVIYLKSDNAASIIKVRSLWDDACDRENLFAHVRMQYDIS